MAEPAGGASPSGKSILRGTAGILLAEGLMLPTGLLTAAFLTRQLEPSGYGLFTLTAAIVAWIEWSIASMFARTAVKFVGEAEDWRPVGATLIRLYLGISLVAALALWLLAPRLADLLKEPVLTRYLRIFAIDIPLFSLGQAHQNVLVGLGLFHQRAFASAGRWIARLVFILVLVGAGLSITGAILATIGASVVDLTIGRLCIRPSIYRHDPLPMKHLWGYAIPLFLSAVSLRTFDKIDLLTLKALGGTAEQAGFYGAAQNLAIIPGLVALSFSPTLLSNLSQLQRLGEVDRAKHVARQALRLTIILMPLAGLTAGAASDIVHIIFGDRFLSTAPILAILFAGSLAMVTNSAATVILVAAGKPTWMFLVTSPLPVLALLGNLWMVPKLGAIGAALVTASLGVLVALVSIGLVYCLWRILPPFSTLWRSLLISGLVYGLATGWQVSDSLVVLKLLALTLLIPMVFLVLGELQPKEMALLLSVIPRQLLPSWLKHKLDELS